MRERGLKNYALINGKMVKFSQRAKYEAWFDGELRSIELPLDRSEYLTGEQVRARLVALRTMIELRAKVTRRRK